MFTCLKQNNITIQNTSNIPNLYEQKRQSKSTLGVSMITYNTSTKEYLMNS